MSYKAQFNGWDELTLADLLVAYRKAKADCFFEKCFPTAVKFAEYEENLLDELESLLKSLKQKNKKSGKKGINFNSSKFLSNSCRLVPKKLSITPKKDIKNSHIHFSNPERAFEYLHSANNLEPEFRIVGDFSVDIHIISALWINMIGHKFDACLDDKKVYATRLKRVRNEDELDKKVSKQFHITAIGSFPHYSKSYQKWRNNGLKAIRTELEQNHPVIAVSLDLKSYYHLIDPSFIASIEFQKEVGLELTEQECDFTIQLSKLLVLWSKKAAEFAKKLLDENETPVSGGLTIGLTASRIISNVLLHKWDRLIQERLTPVHYGRYVDDMFLVLHDPKNITDTKSFMSFLRNRLQGESDEVLTNNGNDENDILEINLGEPYQKKSKIQLQSGKQKLFILEGRAGIDLLDSIAKEIRDLSSEYRLMPEPDQLELSTAARVLSAAGNIGEEADTLRHADGLTIRRLSWALQLRNVETLAHDLPPQAWKNIRNEFYAFTYNHVLRAEKIFDQYPYLPRLLGLAVSLKDWYQAETIVRKSFEAFDLLAKADKAEIVINGSKCNIYEDNDSVWQSIKYSLALAFIDAVIRYYPVDFLHTNEPSKKLSNLAKILSEFSKEATIQNFHEKALLLAWSDLAKKPYKRLFNELFNRELNNCSFGRKKLELKIAYAFRDLELLNCKYLKSFLKASQYMRLDKNKEWFYKFERITPFLFPTRPYSSEEISVLVRDECIFGKKPLQTLARYMEVIRGISFNKDLLNDEVENTKDTSKNNPQLPIVTIGTKKSSKVLVAITNLATANKSWEASACNKSNLSVERYQQLSELINQAIKLKPRPDYLLLPELSLPLEWIDSVSCTLQHCGINLIAGTEYRHIGEDDICSEACLILRDERLGYPSTVRIWQPKLEPAVNEDKDLIYKFGKNWKKFSKTEKQKPVYSHNGFCFGVMICSELQNSKARIAFQGEVDALLVLAWNPDLDTFSALVESAALDVHAYTVLVNNRNYGDSRVRVPAKESFKRDLARLRGGENDFCVTVELDIEKLRAFQSRAKRWAEKSDPFKPIPEGFKISGKRKHLPPK